MTKKIKELKAGQMGDRAFDVVFGETQRYQDTLDFYTENGGNRKLLDKVLRAFFTKGMQLGYDLGAATSLEITRQLDEFRETGSIPDARVTAAKIGTAFLNNLAKA